MDISERIKQLSNKYAKTIIETREFLHAHPELEFNEVNTSSKIIEHLEALGIEYKRMAKTGVVAIIKGKKEGKTVLLRGDMDALPIQEETDVPYKSKNAGVMHACGHDSHTAGLLGALFILNELKDEISGTIKFAFQPAEEATGGAKPMIDEGILENPKVDAAFGLHVWGSYPKNTVYIKKGPLMASPDMFEITVIGKGGHASMPNVLVDPVVMSAEIILNIQTIISRRINPLKPAVISCSSIHGGSAHNIIPNEVKITGTIRTLDQEIRDMIPKFMEETVKGVTDIYGGTYIFDYKPGYPALINDNNSTELFIKSAEKIMGENNVFIMDDPIMGGEDFAFFSQAVPSAFLFQGIADDMDNPPIHHHPKFQFGSENTPISSQLLAQVAVDFLSK